MLEITALAIEHNVKIGVVWFGPFIAVIWCVHPVTIKPVLQGMDYKIYNFLKSEGRERLYTHKARFLQSLVIMC